MSKAQLLELYDHVIEVRIWNSKSKVSPKAKYDRPKAFRISIHDSLTQHKGDETNLEIADGDTSKIMKHPSKFAVVSHDLAKRMKAGNRRLSKSISSPAAQVVVSNANDVTLQSTSERVDHNPFVGMDFYSYTSLRYFAVLFNRNSLHMVTLKSLGTHWGNFLYRFKMCCNCNETNILESTLLEVSMYYHLSRASKCKPRDT